jgi:DNA uptake protein ComE-like DNA-binding protein
MHQSLAVTDYPTALDEGFAEHFQPLTREVTNNERLLRLERGTHDENLRSLWLSARDRRLRNDGVRANLFVHRKAPPAAAWDTDADRYRLWLASETSSAFDASELKNGQEMMASEGLIATLFYRIVSDERLRERRREPRFYDRFLGPSGAQPNAASPSPYENVALKLVAALSEVGRRGLDPGRPGMIDLVRAYGELFPDEREAITDVFVRTTCGATASRETADAIRALARSGSSGDIETFAGALPATRAQLEALVADVSAGRVALDAALGPELWLSNDSFKIAASPWSAERDRPLAFNLNTATEADLMSLPGLDARVARRIVAARDAKGTFTSLDDLAAIDGVGAALLGRLRERRTAP